MNIERTLFWFKDGDENLSGLNEHFFALGVLMNRLLNEKYEGKKIKFINIDFSTQRTYEMHPNVSVNNAYFYGGHLRYYGTLNLSEFGVLNEEQQSYYIWKKASEYLQHAAKIINNQSLLLSSEYAYEEGLIKNLNPDYRLIEADVLLYNQLMKASIWVNFKKDGMYSKFTLENKGQIVFEEVIDKTKNSVEFFLEMYKRIEVEGNTIIIKGRKDVDYLPLALQIEKGRIKL